MRSISLLLIPLATMFVLVQSAQAAPENEPSKSKKRTAKARGRYPRQGKADRGVEIGRQAVAVSRVRPEISWSAIQTGDYFVAGEMVRVSVR